LANGVFLIFAPDDDLSHAQSCQLDLEESTQPPTAPVATVTEVQPGEITLGWDHPLGAAGAPVSYQVLCADANGFPLPNVPYSQTYSWCQNGMLERAHTVLPPETGGLFETGRSATGPISDLDPAYICTGPIVPDLTTAPAGATTLTMSMPMTALDPLTTYQFVVVAVDAFGNATASSVITAETPGAGDHPPYGCGCDYSAGHSPSGGAASLFACMLLAVALSRSLRRRR